MNKVNILSIPKVVVNHLNCPKYVRYFLKKHKYPPFLPHYLILRPFLISCFPSVKYQPFHSVQFSHSVMSCSLWCHGLQHARPPCPSPTPRACLNSCSLNRWCHPTISSSVIPFSCLQSHPASRSLLMSRLFASGGASTSVSVLPMNNQDWFPSGFMGLISLHAVPGTLKSLLQHHSSKAWILWSCFLYSPTLTSIHEYCKNHSFD